MAYTCSDYTRCLGDPTARIAACKNPAIPAAMRRSPGLTTAPIPPNRRGMLSPKTARGVPRPARMCRGSTSIITLPFARREGRGSPAPASAAGTMGIHPPFTKITRVFNAVPAMRRGNQGRSRFPHSITSAVRYPALTSTPPGSRGIHGIRASRTRRAAIPNSGTAWKRRRARPPIRPPLTHPINRPSVVAATIRISRGPRERRSYDAPRRHLRSPAGGATRRLRSPLVRTETRNRIARGERPRTRSHRRCSRIRAREETLP